MWPTPFSKFIQPLLCWQNKIYYATVILKIVQNEDRVFFCNSNLQSDNRQHQQSDEQENLHRL